MSDSEMNCTDSQQKGAGLKRFSQIYPLGGGYTVSVLRMYSKVPCPTHPTVTFVSSHILMWSRIGSVD